MPGLSRIRSGAWFIRIAACLMASGPAAASPIHLPTIHVYDLQPAASLPAARRYDMRHVAAGLQGLINRDAPRLLLYFHDRDPVWLTRLRGPGGLCENWPVETINSFEQLVQAFSPYVTGVVLYDPNPNTGVISTSLAATTAAACENGLAVRKDTAAGSVYNWLVNDPAGPRFPVLLDLTGKFTGSGTIWDTQTPSTGSAKCDAYVWAKQKYLDTGRTDPTVLSYTLDLWGLKVNAELGAQLSNLDYAVARKAFCFEVSPWGDEPPNDDPAQPLGTDLNTFKSILDGCNARTGHGEMVQFVGFINWPFKYTSRTGGLHGDVETEWQLAWLLSAYNAYMEADAAGLQYISNTSFYAALLPGFLERRYVQNPAPTHDQLAARGFIDQDGNVVDGEYVMIGLGDYDQASWTLYWLAAERYDDPARGSVVCNWGIDPNAIDRVCVAMDDLYRRKSANDFFLAWDSGAGYVNPSQLRGARPPSGYPSGVNLWRAHCRHYYRLLDYSTTGWLLNGAAGTLTAIDYATFTPFSADGIGTQAGNPPGPTLTANIPVRERFPSDAWPPPVPTYPSGVHFDWFRTILVWPNQVSTFVEGFPGAGSTHHFLDPFTFYYLMRHHLGGNNNHRATWIEDTIPRVLTAGDTYAVTVTVRNDGWDTWRDSADYGLGHAFLPPGQAPIAADYAATVHPLPGGADVNPGQTAVFSFDLTAPAAPASYDLYYDMLHDTPVTPFAAHSNIEWKKPVIVAAHETAVDTDGDGRSDVFEEANGLLPWHPDDAIDLGPAGSPQPVPGALLLEPHTTLSWTAAPGATLQRVHFGAQRPPAFQQEQSETAFAAGPLEAADTYYWRIDQVGPAGTTIGEPWSFRTAAYRGDLDLDWDVDLDDFGRFQRCYSGPGVVQSAAGCEAARIDPDDDVDPVDFFMFQGCMSGTGFLPDSGCAG